ncbi:18233_t:CDS:2 [Dentiscutata erythropus]|uniref:18233_t:CDS:1 n=1 Tax=Dentiscutata erythropus TaxID=1348616 RepID=A0A9N9BJR2_9GLOM|nr:18233_t:CDS:2 [Dentiscutata erythropus]
MRNPKSCNFSTISGITCTQEKISDTNLSKNDLEEICHSLGVSIEETKTDLIQRFRNFSNEENQTRFREAGKAKVLTFDKENDNKLVDLEYPNEGNEVLKVDPQMQTLRELAQRSREKQKPNKPLQANAISVKALATLQMPAHQIQMQILSISNQKNTQYTRTNLTSYKKIQRITDYARVQQLIPVVDRIHIKDKETNKLAAADHEALWPHDPLPVEALRTYIDNPPIGVSDIIWK